MKKIYDKENGKTTWSLSAWWEKTIYVIGFCWMVYLGLCFLVGLMIGISEL